MYKKQPVFHDIIKDGITLIDDGIIDVQIPPGIEEEVQAAPLNLKRRKQKAPVAEKTKVSKKPRRLVDESESEEESFSQTKGSQTLPVGPRKS